MNNTRIMDIVFKLFVISFLITPTISYAVELDTEISEEDKAAFDNILLKFSTL
ncbi:MAG: hypothetical protein KAK00_06875 [Nanoarchaeota archaeon]|nr:hypothetical protein [Nanoarchaeota archaeon]